MDPLPGTTLLDLGGLQDEVQTLLNIKVDLIKPGDLPIRIRTTVMNEARPV